MNVQTVPLSCGQLAIELERPCNSRFLLIDVRPNPQYCRKHIQQSESINFSSILLRRLMKGVVQLETLVPCQELAQKITSRNSKEEKIVIYDSCSTTSSIKPELLKHAEVLAKTEYKSSTDNTVYFLDGGFDAMSLDYPHLCAKSTKEDNQKARSPLGISISASLPVLSLSGSGQRSYHAKTLQTPSSDKFGPPVEILPHLMLGCAKDSGNLTLLRKRGVTAILNVSHNCPNHFETLLEYKCIAVQDSYQADLLSKMEMAIDYINSIKAKNGCVFVHCHAGISRSATICIAYIMKTMKCDLAEAYEFVKQKRPCVSPNLHFMGQLLAFQKQLEESGKEMEVHSHINTGETGGMQFNVSGHHNLLTSPVMEEDGCGDDDDDMNICDDLHCSSGSPLPSASAPSSLNFDNGLPLSEIAGMHQSPQVASKKRAIKKPTFLPLQLPQPIKMSQQKVNADNHSTMVCEIMKETPLSSSKSSSMSLPTTPLAQYRNPLSVERRVASSPLQHSPCRVVALLGSRSAEACLNYAPLTESM